VGDKRLTRSTAPNPAFEGGVEKRRSGSTLSKPQPLGWGAEGLTKEIDFDIKLLIRLMSV